MIYFWFVFVAVVGYFVGSLNYSIIVSRIFTDSDIRSKGSGNAGSTNMMRNHGWKAGVLTLCVDFMKTFAVCNGAWSIFILTNPEYAQTASAIAGFFCAFGHCFPVFFGFKGGKGVAVGGLTILMIDWRCFIVTVSLFLIFAALFRYVSLGSIMGALSFPVSLAFFIDFSKPFDIVTYVFACMLVALVVSLHYQNIGRLFKGTESKLSFHK